MTMTTERDIDFVEVVVHGITVEKWGVVDIRFCKEKTRVFCMRYFIAIVSMIFLYND